MADNSALVLNLEGDIPEQARWTSPSLLQEQPPMTVLETWQFLRKAAADSRIKALVLEPRGLTWDGRSSKSCAPI